MSDYYDNTEFVTSLSGNSGNENSTALLLTVAIIGLSAIGAIIYLKVKSNQLEAKLNSFQNANKETEA
jgi:hypothetical protein